MSRGSFKLSTGRGGGRRGERQLGNNSTSQHREIHGFNLNLYREPFCKSPLKELRGVGARVLLRAAPEELIKWKFCLNFCKFISVVISRNIFPHFLRQSLRFCKTSHQQNSTLSPFPFHTLTFSRLNLVKLPELSLLNSTTKSQVCKPPEVGKSRSWGKCESFRVLPHQIKRQ